MRDFVNEVSSIWVKETPNQLAAALAYYGLFSFAPVIYLAFRIADLFINQLKIADQWYLLLEKVLGFETANLIRNAILALSRTNRDSSFLLSLISSLAIFYAASSLFFQLQDALNKIWKVPQNDKGYTKKLVRKRLVSILVVIGVGMMLVAATLVSIVLTWFGSLLKTYLEIRIIYVLLTWGGNLALIIVSLALLYKVLPDVQIAWRDVWPGAFTSAVLIMIAGTLAALFIGSGRTVSALEITGSFAVLLIAIYYFAQIFLLGAVITRVTAGRHVSGVFH